MSPSTDSLGTDPNNKSVTSPVDGKQNALEAQKNAKGFVWPCKPPVFEDKHQERKYLKERLAAAFRIFADQGWEEGIAGHITVRDPVEPTTMWVNPFGLSFRMMKASDLLRIDSNGAIVEGGQPNRQVYNQAAFAIHEAIHQARPEVIAACHSHSLYGKTFATLGIELPITTQDSCVFYNDCGLYPSFGGVVLADEESQQIVKHLANKKAIILQNHGILTVGRSLEAAVAWFWMLDRHAQVSLLADAAAKGRGIEVVTVGKEEAEFTHKSTGSDEVGYQIALPLFDNIELETKGAYKE